MHFHTWYKVIFNINEIIKLQNEIKSSKCNFDRFQYSYLQLYTEEMNLINDQPINMSILLYLLLFFILKKYK